MEIKKLGNGVVCWKIDTTDVSYNTELSIAQGLTLLITYEGNTYIAGARDGVRTFGSIVNPKKTKKFFGGNKELDCTIMAIDEDAEYSALWGVGIPNFVDKVTKTIHAVQSNGRYFFKIYSMENFISSMKVDTKNQLTEDDVKLLLRDKIHEVIRSGIGQLLDVKSVLEAQGSLPSVSSAIVEKLNRAMKSNGVQFTNVVINLLNYSADDADAIDEIRKAQLDTTIAKIKNEATRDDFKIRSEYKDLGKEVAATNADDSLTKVRICPRCHSENSETAVFCNKCGEKLI